MLLISINNEPLSCNPCVWIGIQLGGHKFTKIDICSATPGSLDDMSGEKFIAVTSVRLIKCDMDFVPKRLYKKCLDTILSPVVLILGLERH